MLPLTGVAGARVEVAQVQQSAEAIIANQNLKVAAAPISQARAPVGVANAGRFPQINGGGGVTREKPASASLGQPDDSNLRPFTVWRGLVGRAKRIR